MKLHSSLKHVHILGMLLDSFLSLDAQFSAMARIIFAQLELLHQLFLFLEMSHLSTVIYALVKYNTFYMGLPLESGLQRVEKAGSR